MVFNYVIKHHAMKAYRGTEVGYSSVILDLGTRCR
jgi:hypothetical protein